eukprot:2133611-Rhodomonas_salina.4
MTPNPVNSWREGCTGCWQCRLHSCFWQSSLLAVTRPGISTYTSGGSLRCLRESITERHTPVKENSHTLAAVAAWSPENERSREE